MRSHLIRFHGVLAPNARMRPEIIPSSGAKQGRLRPRPASLALGYSPLALAFERLQIA